MYLMGSPLAKVMRKRWRLSSGMDPLKSKGWKSPAETEKCPFG
jgi:hypothetical protein